MKECNIPCVNSAEMFTKKQINFCNRRKSFRLAFYSFLFVVALCWTITFFYAFSTVSQLKLTEKIYNYGSSVLHNVNSPNSFTFTDDTRTDDERVHKLAIKMLADAEDHRVRKIALEIGQIESLASQKKEKDLIEKYIEHENGMLYYQMEKNDDVKPNSIGEEKKIITHIDYQKEKQFDDQYYSYYEDDDTKDSVVIGMGFNSPKIVYQRFVGSLPEVDLLEI